MDTDKPFAHREWDYFNRLWLRACGASGHYVESDGAGYYWPIEEVVKYLVKHREVLQKFNREYDGVYLDNDTDTDTDTDTDNDANEGGE